MRSVKWPATGRLMSTILDIRNISAAVTFGLLTSGAVVLSGCSSSEKLDPFAGKGSPMYTGSGPIPKGGGRRHIGEPYTIAGQKFYPKADPTYDRVGIASWYGPKFHKRMTSNGEWFDMDHLTAAHTTLPLPSYAKVTNQTTGRSLIVRVNDRGPFVGDRIIDLSRKSAKVLGVMNKGTGQVRVQYIGPAPLDDKGAHLAAMNAELRRGTPLSQMIARVDGKSSPTQVAALRQPRALKGSGQYFVQVAAFSDENNAYRTQDRLRNLGPVIITPVNGNVGTLYRVRVGPLRSEADAHDALDRVIQSGHHDARVMRVAQY